MSMFAVQNVCMGVFLDAVGRKVTLWFANLFLEYVPDKDLGAALSAASLYMSCSCNKSARYKKPLSSNLRSVIDSPPLPIGQHSSTLSPLPSHRLSYR